MSFFRPIALFRLPVFLFITACIIWIEWTVTHTSAFSQYPVGLSLAVLFDLVFVTTALFYGLVVRPLQWAPNRVWLVALLMLRVALFILPETPHLPNQIWPLLLVCTEGIILIMAGLRIRTITRMYRQLRPTTNAETALRGSLSFVFGERIAGGIIGELLTLYYALLGWQLRSDIPDGATPLTTYRESGQIALTVTLLFVGLIEGVVVHVLLNRWNSSVAFWVTALSVYGMLFFVADAVATIKRPSYLTDNQLHIRLGVRWQAIIPQSAIVQVSRIQEKPPKQPGQLNGAFLTAPNVLLTFSQPVYFTGPYGLQKQVQTFSFFVDDPATFVRALSES